MDWTIFATLGGFAFATTGAIIGANYKFTKDIRDDLKSEISEFKNKFDLYTKETDKKWYDLLKEIHFHDKRIDRLEQK